MELVRQQYMYIYAQTPNTFVRVLRPRPRESKIILILCVSNPNIKVPVRMHAERPLTK